MLAQCYQRDTASPDSNIWREALAVLSPGRGDGD
jgi:hypothetical protein